MSTVISTAIIVAALLFFCANQAPEPVAIIFQLIAAIALIAAACCVVSEILKYSAKREKRKNEEPNPRQYSSRKKYERKHKEWEEEKKRQEAERLAKLPLGERLEARNHSHCIGIYERLGEKCLICGRFKAPDESWCRRCSELYRKSPKNPMPEGLSERNRKWLWGLQQSIIIDYQQGLIDWATAEREMAEAPEYIKENLRHQETQKQESKEDKYQRELRERLELSERLAPKKK